MLRGEDLNSVIYTLQEYKNVPVEIIDIKTAKQLLKHIKFLQQIIRINQNEIKNTNRKIEFLENKIKEITGIDFKTEFFLKLRNDIENMYTKKDKRMNYILNIFKNEISKKIESKEQIQKKMELYKKFNIEEYKKYKLILENYDKHKEISVNETLNKLKPVLSQYVGSIMKIKYLENKNKKYECLISDLVCKINKIL